MRNLATRWQRVLKRVLRGLSPLLLGWLLLGGAAGAHPMPHTIVKLAFLESGVQGVAAMPLPELEAAWQALAPQTPMDNGALSEYFRRHIRAEAVDDASTTWETQITSVVRQTQKDGLLGAYGEIEVRFVLLPDPASSGSARRALRLHYDAVLHQVVTHKALIFIEHDWRTGIIPDRMRQIGLVGTDVVSGKVLPIDIRLDAGSWLRGFFAMVLYGSEHMLLGADHILFLCMLLVVAPLSVVNKASGGHAGWSDFQGVGHAFRRFLRISVAFTLGHSLTLALGVFNLVQIPSRLIEFVIALSVAVSAVHALKPLYAGREAYVAGLFGLAHGLAFAYGLSSVLANDRDSRLAGLLGFNLGVELMQLGVMAVCLPLIRLSRHRGYVHARIGLSIMTLVAALYWMWQVGAGSAT
jgi:HupE / UreJ protein